MLKTSCGLWLKLYLDFVWFFEFVATKACGPFAFGSLERIGKNAPAFFWALSAGRLWEGLSLTPGIRCGPKRQFSEMPLQP